MRHGFPCLDDTGQVRNLGKTNKTMIAQPGTVQVASSSSSFDRSGVAETWRGWLVPPMNGFICELRCSPRAAQI